MEFYTASRENDFSGGKYVAVSQVTGIGESLPTARHCDAKVKVIAIYRLPLYPLPFTPSCERKYFSKDIFQPPGSFPPTRKIQIPVSFLADSFCLLQTTTGTHLNPRVYRDTSMRIIQQTDVHSDVRARFSRYTIPRNAAASVSRGINAKH